VRYSVFSHMIRNFKTWAVGGDSSFSSDVDKTYTFLRHCILAADMPHLIRIFNLNLDRSVFPMMVLNKVTEIQKSHIRTLWSCSFLTLCIPAPS
jgi:hypothetical protein